MREARTRSVVLQMLRLHGYEVGSDGAFCPRCKRMVGQRKGWPDIRATHPRNRTMYIEAKSLASRETAFKFSKIKSEQRSKLNELEEQGYLVFVALGIIRDNGSGDRLSQLYLVPWGNWLDMELDVLQYQDSIPLTAGKHKSRALQDAKLDITNLLSRWGLNKIKKGWDISMLHPAFKYICGG